MHQDHQGAEDLIRERCQDRPEQEDRIPSFHQDFGALGVSQLIQVRPWRTWDKNDWERRIASTTRLVDRQDEIQRVTKYIFGCQSDTRSYLGTAKKLCDGAWLRVLYLIHQLLSGGIRSHKKADHGLKDSRWHGRTDHTCWLRGWMWRRD